MKVVLEGIESELNAGRIVFVVVSKEGAQQMSKDWMDALFDQKEAEEQQATDKRKQELVRARKLVELARPIWADIETRLKDRINAFNLKVRPDSQVRVLPHSGEFSLQLQHRRAKNLFVISFTPDVGVLSYGMRLRSGERMQGWLSVKIDEHSHYTVEKAATGEKVEIEEIDEVILKDYLVALIG